MFHSPWRHSIENEVYDDLEVVGVERARWWFNHVTLPHPPHVFTAGCHGAPSGSAIFQNSLTL